MYQYRHAWPEVEYLKMLQRLYKQAEKGESIVTWWHPSEVKWNDHRENVFKSVVLFIMCSENKNVSVLCNGGRVMVDNFCLTARLLNEAGVEFVRGVDDYGEKTMRINLVDGRKIEFHDGTKGGGVSIAPGGSTLLVYTPKYSGDPFINSLFVPLAGSPAIVGLLAYNRSSIREKLSLIVNSITWRPPLRLPKDEKSDENDAESQKGEHAGDGV